MTCRIVFAEEDAGARRQIAVALRRWGYAVTEAGDGDESLAAIEAAAPDLLLASTTLPYEFLDEARRWIP